jgi:hypothetical protein
MFFQKFDEYLRTAELERRVASNMSAVLHSDMEAAYEQNPLREKSQRTATWRTWCDETGAAVQDDSDEELQVGQGAVFKNTRCVLSQKSIFDLDEPVEDRLKYVWEKAFIVGYINERNGRCDNPAQPGEPITLAELHPSRRVRREAERRKKANKQLVDETEVL